jgi:hypothetical protein
MICLCVVILLGSAPVATGQWQHLGLETKQVISLECNPYSVDYIYAGTYYEGLFMTSDGGQSWHNKIASNVPVSFISVDPHSPPTLFALVSDSWSAGLYNSLDNGENWNAINYLPFPRRMGFDPYLSGHFYVCFSSGIMTSSDYGVSFIDASSGLPHLNIYDVKGHGVNRFEGFAVGETFVCKTASFGQIWEDVGGMFGIEDYNPARMEYEPGAPDTLYVTTWAYLARSFDGAETWEYFETPTVYNVPIACDRSKPGQIYIGSIGGGVLMSNDAGATFLDITGDLGNTNVYSLDIDIQGRLLAGTGNGVYICDLTTGVEPEAPLPQTPILNQNYPNPFNASTRISMWLPDSRAVTLKVYDLLGRHVQTLVDGETLEGSYTVTFDGTDLPSGIYFYRLQAGDFTDTKTLTLLK